MRAASGCNCGPMYSLPNLLTMFRIALVPLFALAFAVPGPAGKLVAFAIFVLAGVTDFFDGLAARRLKSYSDFGRMLDPIADKILVATALMMLVAGGAFDGYKLIPALVILCREILVSGLREFLAGVRVSVPVSSIAKLKTTIQMIAIAAMILGPSANRVVPGALAFAVVLLWVAAALTVYTGAVYFRAGLAHLDPKPRAKEGDGQQHRSAGEPA